MKIGSNEWLPALLILAFHRRFHDMQYTGSLLILGIWEGHMIDCIRQDAPGMGKIGRTMLPFCRTRDKWMSQLIVCHDRYYFEYLLVSTFQGSSQRSQVSSAA